MEAEALRLKHHARRTVTRVALGCFAMILLLGAIVFLHIAIWDWLREYLPGKYVGLIFMAFDLVVAAVLGWLAARSTPGLVEREALAVRRRALTDAVQSVTVSALLFRWLKQLVLPRTRR